MQLAIVAKIWLRNLVDSDPVIMSYKVVKKRCNTIYGIIITGFLPADYLCARYIYIYLDITHCQPSLDVHFKTCDMLDTNWSRACIVACKCISCILFNVLYILYKLKRYNRCDIYRKLLNFVSNNPGYPKKSTSNILSPS